jgi:hypothetical protein
MTSRVLGCCLLHRVFIHLAFDDQSVARHGTGDGKKRVALQKENNKNGREAKPEHNKAPNRQSPAMPSHQQTCQGHLFRRRG